LIHFCRDQVRAAKKIAEIGNSGNSDQPHLHLQNTPEFDVDTPVANARTYPWLFHDVVLTRSGDTSRQPAADLRRGDSFAVAS
jgi:hypothetical protein